MELKWSILGPPPRGKKTPPAASGLLGGYKKSRALPLQLQSSKDAFRQPEQDRTESVGFVRLNTFAKICASCRFCGLDDPNMYQKLPKMFKTSSLRGKSAPKVVPMADRGGQGTSKRPEKEPRGPPWAPLGGPWGLLVRPKGSEMEP